MGIILRCYTYCGLAGTAENIFYGDYMGIADFEKALQVDFKPHGSDSGYLGFEIFSCDMTPWESSCRIFSPTRGGL